MGTAKRPAGSGWEVREREAFSLSRGLRMELERKKDGTEGGLRRYNGGVHQQVTPWFGLKGRIWVDKVNRRLHS